MSIHLLFIYFRTFLDDTNLRSHGLTATTLIAAKKKKTNENAHSEVSCPRANLKEMFTLFCFDMNRLCLIRKVFLGWRRIIVRDREFGKKEELAEKLFQGDAGEN